LLIKELKKIGGLCRVGFINISVDAAAVVFNVFVVNRGADHLIAFSAIVSIVTDTLTYARIFNFVSLR
jgi:hypothetical protein